MQFFPQNIENNFFCYSLFSRNIGFNLFRFWLKMSENKSKSTLVTDLIHIHITNVLKLSLNSIALFIVSVIFLYIKFIICFSFLIKWKSETILSQNSNNLLKDQIYLKRKTLNNWVKNVSIFLKNESKYLFGFEFIFSLNYLDFVVIQRVIQLNSVRQYWSLVLIGSNIFLWNNFSVDRALIAVKHRNRVSKNNFKTNRLLSFSHQKREKSREMLSFLSIVNVITISVFLFSRFFPFKPSFFRQSFYEKNRNFLKRFIDF